MPNTDVQYTMSLKDMLTGKINEASGAIGGMEGHLMHAKEAAMSFGKELLIGVGAGFAVFKGVEFIKEAHEEFEKLEFSASQIEAGLESTHAVAGLTFDALKQGAFDAAHNLKFTQAEIMGMQSILLTFPGITQRTFGEASTAIEDMSTRLGQSVKDTAIQVGKALQDPIKGVTALRRVGVNFNETQTEMIKKMVESGHAAQAQSFILKELQTEFAGSAAAAAKAEVGFRFKKSMEELSLTVGELVDKIEERMMPIMEALVGGFKNLIDWTRKHADLIKALAIGVGVAAAAYVIYKGVILAGVAASAISTAWTYAQTAAMYVLEGAYEGASVATKVMAAAQYLLNAAWDANPIGIVVLGIAALTAAVVYCYHHFATFRGILMGVWETLKEFARIVADVFIGVGHVIHGVLHFSPSEILDGAKQSISAVAEAGVRMGNAFQKGFNDGVADFAKDKESENAPKTIVKKAGALAQTTPPETKKQTAKTVGNKSTTINIRIDSLIKDFSIQTKNITESATKVKDMITQVMVGAVNDSQIVAGQ